MNIFNIFIPKERVQSVKELESWTVTWEFKSGWADDVETRHKVFINKEDAKEFRKQLEESAKFIGCWISTEQIKN